MTLEEFIVSKQQRLEAFRTFWMAENVKHPESYPMEMDEGEWVEQVRFM